MSSIGIACWPRGGQTAVMRDATQQLTVFEQVGVWSSTKRAVRGIVLFVSVLPLVPIMGMFGPDHPGIWIIGPVVLATTPFTLDRMYRTDLSAAESRRVLESQLTGWSTGDARLDGWVLHRAIPAAERRRRHPTGAWLAVALMTAVLLALTVAAAVLISPWWLVCLVTLPLYLALPIARAQSDPDAVVKLLIADT